MYFKGGTALNKIFLNHLRLSEDLDFTVTESVYEKEKEIKDIISKLDDFREVKHDKRVEHFVRLIAHYSKEEIEGTVIIDLNSKAKLLLRPMHKELKHFYPEFIPSFKVNTLHINEMIAEKVVATCNRYAPRDYFDLYNIIQLKLPVSISLVKKKCKLEGEAFDVKNLFKNSNRIFRSWDEDLLPLTSAQLPFKTVIIALKKFFKYRG